MTGTPRITSGWSVCLITCTASFEVVPRTIRSGQLKSSTAHPSVKNIGCETRVARRLCDFKLASRRAAVPTFTGVTMDRMGGFVADRAMCKTIFSVSYTHLRAHETPEHLVCRLLLEKKKK